MLTRISAVSSEVDDVRAEVLSRVPSAADVSAAVIPSVIRNRMWMVLWVHSL